MRIAPGVILFSYYDILGVPPHADLGHIRRSYQAQAKKVHPDLHPGAPPSVIERMNVAMAALNEAWATLSDPARRAAYDAKIASDISWPLHQGEGGTRFDTSAARDVRTAPPAGPGEGDAGDDFDGDAGNPSDAGDGAEGGPRPFEKGTGYGYGGGSYRDPPPFRFHPKAATYRDALFPDPDTCFMCGAKPARRVVLRQQTVDHPVLGLPRESWTASPFCRSCGTGMFRDMTDYSLRYGWWAIVAVVTDLVVVVLNVLAYITILRLGPPVRGDEALQKPWYRPHPMGRSLLLRRGALIWIAAACATGAVVAFTHR